MALNFVGVTSWKSYFSCRGYSSSMSTWKYCVGAVLIAGDFVLGFFVGCDSGEVGGVAGLLMIGDGVICAVFGGLCTVMVASMSICSVCGAGDIVSFSSVVGCRRAGGFGLVVGGGGCLAAVGWRGHSPAEGAGCLLLSALLLYTGSAGSVGNVLWEVSST